MRPLVTVVIPAHNPGRYVEPCIRSLLRQSMPRDRFEVVFVDDGSTDGTGERLKRLAREQPHVRVIQIPASGGPGRPRNVGIEAAVGEYIQFLDADDELAPRALERLVRMAHANRSDIVLGKFASETMRRRQDLFTRTRPATTLDETRQLADASMGPTKLFRTAFLREHEISFPEGWRQMEDQLFTLRAYLAARVISILGDEPCYFFNKREDEGHISAELVEPESHVAHLREILDEIDHGIHDPALRSRFMARFYRAEVLARLAGARFLEADADYQEALFGALGALARERFGGVEVALGAIAKIRSRLLLSGNLAALLELGHRAEAFVMSARILRAEWSNGRLEIEFRATLAHGEGGRSLSLVQRGGSMLLDPVIADDLVGPVDVTDELNAIRAQVSLVDRATALEWLVPSSAGLAVRAARDPVAGADVRIPALVGFLELDPQRVGPGDHPLEDGAWDVMVRWSGLGVHAAGPLRFSARARAAEPPAIRPAVLGRPGRWVVARPDHEGGLRVQIGGLDRAPAAIDHARRRVVRDGRSLAIALPIATAGPGVIATGVLRLVGEAGTFELPATFSAALGDLLVTVADVADRGGIPRGRYELSAHLGGADWPGLSAGAALVPEDGGVFVIGIPRESALGRLRDWIVWSARGILQGVRGRAVSAYRRLPLPLKSVVRATYARFHG